MMTYVFASVPRSTTAARLEMSGLAAIVAGVALVSVPAVAIVAGASVVAAAFALEHPGMQP